MQSSKVLQRLVSSTSTTFSSCSRAAESLDCTQQHAGLGTRQLRNPKKVILLRLGSMLRRNGQRYTTQNRIDCRHAGQGAGCIS